MNATQLQKPERETSKHPFPLFMFVEGEEKQDDIQLHPMFAHSREPAHLLSYMMSIKLLNQTAWLAWKLF